jgi:hypothetical protein
LGCTALRELPIEKGNTVPVQLLMYRFTPLW